MKKAKFVLIAIVVFSTVGGVMAFKAQKLGHILFCSPVAVAGPCDGVEYDTPEQYIPTTGDGLFTAFCTTDNDYPCTTALIFTITAVE